MDSGPKLRREINPRHQANIFSILTFAWTLETFRLGYSRDIQENDLYAPLPEHRSGVLGDAMQKAWDEEVEQSRRRRNGSKPSLRRVLLKVFGAELMLYGLILAAMEFIIRLQQPWFLGLLLRYFNPIQDLQDGKSNHTYLGRLFNYHESETGITWGEAVFLSFGVVFCSAINVIVQHPFMMGVMHIGMKMRVGVCSLIYRKALKVSLQAMSESSAGLVVNLMANDVNRFDTGPLFIHHLWIGPLETVLTACYLYRVMGVSAIYGSLVFIAIIPFQIVLGMRTAHYRLKTAIKSDERVRLMKEIVMGIEVIKMYTWEQPFRKIIDFARRQEIHNIEMTSYIRGMIMSFIMFTSRFAIFITVFCFVKFVNHITVEEVFLLTCFYNITKQTMSLYFPQGLGQLAEMNVAIQRIRDYLLSEECNLPPRPRQQTMYPEDRSNKKKVTIILEPVEMSPSVRTTDPMPSPSNTPSKTKEKISEITIKLENASSKWIRSDRQEDIDNIDLTIYAGTLTTVIGAVGAGKSTLLHVVLGELPCTTGSIITTGHISYASQEPWLFVGSVRQNILFGQPFIKSRYMEVCKVCALERDISLFPHGDKTIVGERGVSLSGGQRARINLARAVYKEADIYLLDDPLSAVDTQVAKHIFERCIKKYLAEKTVVLVTHQLQFIKQVDHIVVMTKGKIFAEGNFNEVMENAPTVMNFMQEKSRNVHQESGPNLQTMSVTQPSAISFRRHLSLILDSNLAISDPRPEVEQQSTGRVQGTIYRDYFLSGAPWPCAFIVGLMFVLAQACASSCDYWISAWSKSEDQMTGDSTMDELVKSEQTISRQTYVNVFAIITIATVVVALTRAFMFFSLCMRSSISLHDKMFECISRSPMSFFHKNSSGRILNRFSKDMGSVDELLPQAMIDCFQILLNLVGIIVIILMTDITLLIPIAATIIIFYIMRVVYIRTSGAVKRLEGITRSPVFSHLTASVLGLATVRSFGAERLLVEEFDRHQDLHSAAWYLFITCSRAFGYWLDVICLLFIICVTFGCLMKEDLDSSNVGLAITQSISMTGIFQWGMRQSAEMENQMTSVERVLEYTNLPQEDAIRSTPGKSPPRGWPSQGGIVFNSLSLKYTPDGHNVLHKLSINIEPQEKIGIVGRTGAGKSSIIQALFRLAYLDGTITIDGVDISTIGLYDLREKISIIPQEPVLFSGSIRKNLDPFNDYPDHILLNALNNVELTDQSEGIEALYKEVTEGGANFSVGERQLVCLARAIVRNNKILVLDEATANVDAQTDAMIQTAIKKHFHSCTVLTIAHRLNTVIDSDKILVLDAGRLMEFEHPHTLLTNTKSHFRRMVAETGPTMAQMLRNIAAEKFNSK